MILLGLLIFSVIFLYVETSQISTVFSNAQAYSNLIHDEKCMEKISLRNIIISLLGNSDTENQIIDQDELHLSDLQY